jgi:hypothetical protein
MDHANFYDEMLGQLSYNAQLDWYEGQFPYQGTSLTFHLIALEEDDVAATVSKARHLLANLADYGQRAKDYAAERLLDLKNDVWLDDDEAPLTADQFKRRMTLESVSCLSDGTVEFFHNDDDLFFGHCILVVMRDDQFVDADIPG